MRKHCLHVFLVLILVASFVGCGGGGTSSVPTVEAQQKSGDAAGKKVMDSSAAGQPNTPGAMPSYYKDYPTGQQGRGPGGAGGPGGVGGPGGAQQPGN